MFGCKWKNVTEDWRYMHNGELHNVYLLTNTIWGMKTVRLKMLGYVSYMGEVINACGIKFGEVKWKRLLWRLGIDGRVKIMWIFKKHDVKR
jgi:hypothetical protein